MPKRSPQKEKPLPPKDRRSSANRVSRSAARGSRSASGASRNAKRSARPVLTARAADKQRCYEAAVQEPDPELDFLCAAYRHHHGRAARPRLIREDFAGSAWNSVEWVKRSPLNRAVAVDLDRRTLLETSRRHTEPLSPEQRSRLRLVHDNVLSERLISKRAEDKPDAIMALNFSYWILHTRADLVRYFANCRRALAKGGLLIMDFVGGSEVFVPQQERRRCKGFTYIWDQASYNPIDGRCVNHIHFEFKDGSRLDRAYTYPWRIWTIPELRDCLADAGFAETQVWAEREDTKGKGTGTYRPITKHNPDPTFLCYLVSRG